MRCRQAPVLRPPCQVSDKHFLMRQCLPRQRALRMRPNRQNQYKGEHDDDRGEVKHLARGIANDAKSTVGWKVERGVYRASNNMIRSHCQSPTTFVTKIVLIYGAFEMNLRWRLRLAFCIFSFGGATFLRGAKTLLFDRNRHEHSLSRRSNSYIGHRPERLDVPKAILVGGMRSADERPARLRPVPPRFDSETRRFRGVDVARGVICH